MREEIMRKSRTILIVLAATLLLSASALAARTDKPKRSRGHRGAGKTNAFNVAVPAHPFDLILNRPGNSSVSLSVLAYADTQGVIVYGTQPGTYTAKTPVQMFKKGLPLQVPLAGLQPDTRYYYQLNSRPVGSKTYDKSPEYSFHTARRPGSTFTFTMTADAHLDEHTSPEIYSRTLEHIRKDAPDFHLDLGNLFMTDKHAARNEAKAQYVAQRYYLGLIGPSVPVLLALGTHDGESAKYLDGSADSLAVWANGIREHYFPNPVPDAFYTGNERFQDYYAWTWGDALFVVLDPFRYSVRQRGGGGDGWGWSLGQEQYQWLEKTLQQSRAKFKFVFIHNLLCGDQAARGGTEVAIFNEWGGKNLDGSDGFKEHRPGWDMPVHQLLVKNHVAAVFKAHDNFFACQQLDGLVYLMVPQPSFAGSDRIRDLENYGYKKGTFLGNTGYVRVTVSPAGAKMEYIRTRLPANATAEHPDGETVFSDKIPSQ